MPCQIINFRTAHIGDAALLSSWDETPHMKVINSHSDWWNWPEELSHPGDWREMLIAELNGVPFGFLQLMNAGHDPHNYWPDLDASHMAIDLWIGPENYLSRGLGCQILRYAISRCFADKSIHTIWIDPQQHNHRAIRFYQKHGFIPVELRPDGQETIHIHKLER